MYLEKILLEVARQVDLDCSCRSFKNVTNCWIANIYFHLETSGDQNSILY